MNIIYTNDDGIQADGIRALVKNVPEGIVAIVVAPASERSASSHSISLGQKLRIEEFEEDGILHFRVHGTPVDCIKFAVSELEDFHPDLIVSGINQGANTGVSVYYSGTISAAREGVINRIPAIAVSLCSKESRDFEGSVAITNRVIQAYIDRVFPGDILVNINVPPLPKRKIKGIKITKQAASRFVEEFVTHERHDRKRVYSLAGEIEVFDKDGKSDEEAVSEGFISITPLKLDLTDYGVMSVFENWVGKK
ncbi:MAG: 5'/3'-nucleotidase SurE [Candidatus Omnitrophota bacterium]|nr:5'/3'-nucleotidase SurE [Candidatus Omnitrophota bacterium]